MTFLHTKIYVRQSFGNQPTQNSILLNKSLSTNALGRYENRKITKCFYFKFIMKAIIIIIHNYNYAIHVVHFVGIFFFEEIVKINI